MTSKYNFLDDELQVTNSMELALHVHKGLSEMRFKQIIELEEENYEQRGRINKLQKELDDLTHMHQAISMVAGLPRKDEMETLIKDGKRMDWLLSHAYAIQVDEGEILSSRQKIDEAMNQATQ
jgi:hypothetical protein